MVEAPYGIIARLLEKGKVTPFLGAGASLSGRGAGVCWRGKSEGFLPKGDELAEYLAILASFPSQNRQDRCDLAKVSSYFQLQSERAALDDVLHDVFDHSDLPLGSVHHLLARIKEPLLIVTTNYDRLMERALDEVGRPYHLVVHACEDSEYAGSVLWWPPGESTPRHEVPARLELEVSDTTVVYKMHGSVDSRETGRDSYVITEEDYVDFLSRMTRQSAVPAKFKLHLRRTHLLFLGYSLQDWNLRVMLRNLQSMPGAVEHSRDKCHADEDRRSWSIQRNPSALDTALWEQRNINIFDADLDAFVKRLDKHLTGDLA